MQGQASLRPPTLPKAKQKIPPQPLRTQGLGTLEDRPPPQPPPPPPRQGRTMTADAQMSRQCQCRREGGWGGERPVVGSAHCLGVMRLRWGHWGDGAAWACNQGRRGHGRLPCLPGTNSPPPANTHLPQAPGATTARAAGCGARGPARPWLGAQGADGRANRRPGVAANLSDPRGRRLPRPAPAVPGTPPGGERRDGRRGSGRASQPRGQGCVRCRPLWGQAPGRRRPPKLPSILSGALVRSHPGPRPRVRRGVFAGISLLTLERPLGAAG